MIRRISSLVVGVVFASAGAVWATGQSHSVNMTLDQAATISGKTLQPGDYRLMWTGEAQKVDVTIESGDKTVAQAEATLKQEPKPTAEASVVLRKTKSGEILEEVRPEGQKTVIVFSHS